MTDLSNKVERAAWHTLPEAATILAELGRNPPERKGFTYAFGDHDVRYVGPKVTRLRKMHQAESERLLAEYDAGRLSLDGMRAHYAFDEQAAIAAAIQQAKARKVAA